MAANNPAFADDVCNGAAEIAEFIREDERRALRLCYTRQIPAWKEGGRWRMRKSRYLEYVVERENASLAGAVPGGPNPPETSRGSSGSDVDAAAPLDSAARPGKVGNNARGRASPARQ